MSDPSENGPARKEAKSSYSSFQDKRLSNSIYQSCLVKIDDYTGGCNKCPRGTVFTVKHDGKKSIKTHSNSAAHRLTMKNLSTNKLITTFMPVKGTSDELKVTATELSQVYHGIINHTSVSNVGMN